MSLYQVQKFIFEATGDRRLGDLFDRDPESFLTGYALTAREKTALAHLDIGTLYLMGVHPHLLLSLAVKGKIHWPDYIAALQRADEAAGREV